VKRREERKEKREKRRETVTREAQNLCALLLPLQYSSGCSAYTMRHRQCRDGVSEESKGEGSKRERERERRSEREMTSGEHITEVSLSLSLSLSLSQHVLLVKGFK